MNISVCLILAILLSVAQSVWAGEVNSIVSFEGWDWEADNRQRQLPQEVLAGPAAYEFFEHPGKWAVDKTFE